VDTEGKVLYPELSLGSGEHTVCVTLTLIWKMEEQL
jgi:hypothetical protein